jgi:hypothetical protein
MHEHQFPHVAVVARKWLCASTTSPTAIRIVSKCGLALTAKCSQVKGSMLRHQVMISWNIRYLRITLNDIQAKFAEEK